MVDQPRVAIGTTQAKAAVTTERQRRVSSAIEKQQRLLLFLQPDFYCFGESRRDEASARWTFAPQIDGLDVGKMLPAKALRQMQPLVAAAPRIDLRLHRRRCRDEHDRDGSAACAHNSHVARMVTRTVLLLVCRIVLLIDDDESEIGVG